MTHRGARSIREFLSPDGGGASLREERGRGTDFIPLCGGTGFSQSERREVDDAELKRVASGKSIVQGEEAVPSWSQSGRRSRGGLGRSSSSESCESEGEEVEGIRTEDDAPAYDGQALVALYKARAPVLIYIGALLFSVATVAAIVVLAIVQAHIYNPTGWIILVAVSAPCGLFLLFLLASAPKEVLFTPYSVILRTQRMSRLFGHVVPLHDVRDVRRMGPCEWREGPRWRTKGRLSGLAGGGVLIAAHRPSQSIIFSPADPVRFWEDQGERRGGVTGGE